MTDEDVEKFGILAEMSALALSVIALSRLPEMDRMWTITDDYGTVVRLSGAVRETLINNIKELINYEQIQQNTGGQSGGKA